MTDDTEETTDEQFEKAAAYLRKGEAERLGKEHGIDPSMIDSLGGEDMASFAKAVAEGVKSAGKPETQAEREKREILGSHYEATNEEIAKFTPEQYLRWRDGGAHIKAEPSDADNESEAQAQVEEQAQAEEMERLDKLSMVEYAQEMNRREKENGQ